MLPSQQPPQQQQPQFLLLQSPQLLLLLAGLPLTLRQAVQLGQMHPQQHQQHQ
jgi:hypothetical protein